VNIPSVYGGANLWGETDKKKARRSRAKSGGRGNDLEWAVQGVLSSPNSLGVKSIRFSETHSCTVSFVISAVLPSLASLLYQIG